MTIAVSSDEHPPFVTFIIENLKKRGHKVLYYGPEPGEEKDWPDATREAALAVREKRADEGVVMCWTGTGACLAANKISGIRAALCADAETARGARKWNDANILALSLRLTSQPVAEEILEAWFTTPPGTDDWNRQQIAKIKAMEKEDRPETM